MKRQKHDTNELIFCIFAYNIIGFVLGAFIVGSILLTSPYDLIFILKAIIISGTIGAGIGDIILFGRFILGKPLWIDEHSDKNIKGPPK